MKGYGPLALASAVLGACAIALPDLGKFMAIGFGIIAIGLGFLGFRQGRPAQRLCGAAAIALGLIALVLGGTKVAATLLAIEHMEKMLVP